MSKAIYGLGVVQEVKRPGKPSKWRARVPDGAGAYQEAGRVATEEEAWAVLRGLAEQRARGELAIGGMTLRRWGLQFLDRREINGTRNIDTDRSRWSAHVESASFVDWQLGDIRPTDVADWIDRLRHKTNPRTGEPFSAQTVKHCVALLRRALHLARLRGLFTGPNPAAGHELPTITSRDDGWTYLLAPEIDRVCTAPAIDEADLGDEDAELTVGDAQDHDLAWYGTQELPFLLDLL